jgi:hypothetical protein
VKKRTSLVPVWNQAPAIEPVSRPYNDWIISAHN